MSVSWKGFSEPCSGVREYTVRIIQDLDGSTVWASEPLDNTATNVALPAMLDTMLLQGEEYAVICETREDVVQTIVIRKAQRVRC